MDKCLKCVVSFVLLSDKNIFRAFSTQQDFDKQHDFLKKNQKSLHYSNTPDIFASDYTIPTLLHPSSELS